MRLWSVDDRRFEIGSEPGTEPTVGEDTTGRDSEPGTPDQYWWRIAHRRGSGAKEEHRELRRSTRLFNSPEDAERDIEKVKAEDPTLADLPVIPIYPSPIP